MRPTNFVNRLKRQVGWHDLHLLFSKILTYKSTKCVQECASSVYLSVWGGGGDLEFFCLKALGISKNQNLASWNKVCCGSNSKIGNEPKVFFFMVSWADEVPKKVNQWKTFHFQWKVYERKGKEWLMDSYLSIIV